MSEIPVSDHQYGIYLQSVVEELELDLEKLQKEKKQIPVSEKFLDRVAEKSLRKLQYENKEIRHRFTQELLGWIALINKAL
jgi:uncharacterized protein Yka (UPF0111/DUF47 family)